MNENIKELALQAGILSKPRQLGPAPVIQPGVLNPLRKYVSDEEHIQDNIDVVRAVLGSNGCNGLEKFSELIIEECFGCIDIMEKIANSSNASIPEDYDKYTYLKTLDSLKGLLKVHFGVEECNQ